MRKKQKIRKNLTEGSIIKALAKLSIPIILANILQTAYQLIDTFWVGRLGKEAIASVSVSFPLIFLMISLGGGFAMAGTILVSQYKGKEDSKSVDHITAQTFLIGIILSILISFIGYISSPYILKLMGVEHSVLLDSIAYLKITFIGTIFVFIFMTFQALMRGVGDVKTPVIIVGITVLLNLILDPLFIFGWKSIPALGVSGAAMATVFTEGLAALISLAVMFKGKGDIKLRIGEMMPDIALMKKIMILGIPSSIDQSSRAIGAWLITFLAATFGTITIAAFGIGIRIWSFVMMPAMGLYMATSAVVGQNIGAGKMDRAIKTAKTSTILGFSVLSLFGILVFVFSNQLATIFIPGEVETIKMASTFIKIVSFSYGLLGLQMGLKGAFNGSGNTKLLMVLSLVSILVLRLPIAFILSKFTSLNEVGIWLSFPLANLISVAITLFLFANGSWKKKKLVE